MIPITDIWTLWLCHYSGYYTVLIISAILYPHVIYVCLFKGLICLIFVPTSKLTWHTNMYSCPNYIVAWLIWPKHSQPKWITGLAMFSPGGSVVAEPSNTSQWESQFLNCHTQIAFCGLKCIYIVRLINKMNSECIWKQYLIIWQSLLMKFSASKKLVGTYIQL